ncbi:hypothetical protein [Lentzea sp. NPDC059081]|uniref:hypothetical protein n=1 Tax=Lentzea sp. NPDC059081 TaxID=3346719 RepID=UPI003689FD21
MSDPVDVLEQLERQADRLVAEFADWAAGQGLDADLFVIEAALSSRVAGDGVLDRWDMADVERLLLDWFPRKVTLEQSGLPGVITTLHHWVDFLVAARGGEAGRVDVLHSAVERCAAEFRARMSDERNHGPAKFWMTRMLEHGVDVADGDAVNGFLGAVQAGEIDYDQDVLAEIMRRHAAGGEDGPAFQEDDSAPLPPVLVPSEGELASAAENTDLVVRFRALVTWVGAGRTLTATKRLRVADARELALRLGVDGAFLGRARSSADLPEVSLLVAWARAARLVRVVKGRLLVVKSSIGLLDRPLDLWLRAFEAFGALGPAACGPESPYEAPSLLGQVLPEVTLDLWLSLYTAGEAPVPVELLAGRTREVVTAGFGFGAGGLFLDLREMMWRRDLTAVLTALETSGALELRTSADPWERDKIAELSGRDDPDLTLVQLTPLGLWGVREALRAEGFDAPSAEELAHAPLARLLDAIEHCGPEIASSLLEAWATSRNAEVAATELAAFCVNGPSPATRLLAWAALGHTGEAGADQARRLRSEGGVAGGMATEWLVSHGELASGAAGHQEMMLALSENLAAAHDHGILIDELAGHPVHDQLGLVRAMATAGHPDSVAMLTTISHDHPRREVAAAAAEALGSSRR